MKKNIFYNRKSMPLLIYGAGNIGKAVYKALLSHNAQVYGFLDQKAKVGDQWEGVPIFHPDWDGKVPNKKNIGVILAIHNRQTEIPPIIELLRKQGYNRIISLVKFYDQFSAEMGDRFWLTGRYHYVAWKKDVELGLTFWADDPSRSLYQALINLRMTGNYSELPVPDLDHQYFPQDIPAWKSPIRMIDGGAYDGDTLRAFANSPYEIESVGAFEPDPENFNNLAKQNAVLSIKNFYLWPCGIYSSTQKLSFTTGVREGSKLSNSGDNIIQGVALDDVLLQFKPNLIKFDIEGAEIEGLLGAKELIKENRPGLAICVYHQPQHLWQIPQLIKNWDLGYKLNLLSHAYNDFDVVMYGIPEE